MTQPRRARRGDRGAAHASKRRPGRCRASLAGQPPAATPCGLRGSGIVADAATRMSLECRLMAPAAGGASSGAGASRTSSPRTRGRAGRGRGREHLGFGAGGGRAPGARSRTSSCRAPRLEPPAALARDLRHGSLRARAARLRALLPRRRARLPRALRQPAGRGGAPARRGRRCGGCSNGARTPARPRSRSAAAPAWWAASSRRVAAATPARSRSTSRRLDRRARGRPRVARGAHPGRRDRARTSRTQLREHGLTLRHFPQSFELSTLGGWIATRAGGHFATLLHPHRRPGRVGAGAHAARAPGRAGGCPGRARGPSPDRMLIGSEGILGVITEAWVRVRPRPRFRASAARAVRRASSGRRGRARARAVRPLPGQLPPARRGRGGAHRRGAGRQALLVLGFESADHPLDAWMARALELCRDHGGRAARGAAPVGERGESEGAWRDAFLRAPYLRDTLSWRGVLSETFETAITWDRFDDFVRGRCARRAERRARRGPGDLPPHARLSGRRGALLHGAGARPGAAPSSSSGHEVKAAAVEAIIAAGGTITHHHAVGRDHRPWYDRQRPEPFAEALRAAKRRARPGGDPQSRRAGGPGGLSIGAAISSGVHAVGARADLARELAQPLRGGRVGPAGPRAPGSATGRQSRVGH